jgi:hypothetical protein
MAAWPFHASGGIFSAARSLLRRSIIFSSLGEGDWASKGTQHRSKKRMENAGFIKGAYYLPQGLKPQVSSVALPQA